ncbi:MAG TPA: efflux RND transporter periplasmic adaptor subunit [Balneolales bacterium]|nr:efflux RND transporter periplasmic adaptor subunit [Balneolales bacterium]
MKCKIGTLGFSLLLIFFTACSSKQGNPGNNKGNQSASGVPIPAVESVQAHYGSLPLKERLTGIVVADNHVSIFPEVNAPVTRVLVNDGDKVKKNEPLVRLRNLDYRKQLDQAKAQYNMAQARVQQAQASLSQIESQYKRTKILGEQKMVSAQEVENQKAQLESAKANFQMAKAQEAQAKANMQQAELNLSYTIVRAPVSGYVGRRNAEVGMQVTPSTRLFDIGNIDKVKVRVKLTEQMVNAIKVGQRVNIITDDTKSDKTVTAKVSRISPFLDPVSHTTQAEIDIINKDEYLKPGMFVSVDVFYGESQQATLVPNSALYQQPVSGETGVYVASSLGKEIKPVKTIDPGNDASLTDATPVKFIKVKLIARGAMVSAVEGIRSGDWVITVGQDLLENINNARIRPVTWNRIMSLQEIQQEDLLDSLMNRENDAKDSTYRSSSANLML